MSPNKLITMLAGPNEKMPCALTIAGSDSGGGAGIAADLKTFAALGVHGLCVVTAVTAQNTRGIDATFELPSEFVTQQLDTVMRDFKVEWAKTGMLYSAGVIKAVRAGVRKYKLRAVVDPVMVAATGVRLLREDAFDSLVKLLGDAEVVTPNVKEAERLSGVKIKSRQDIRKAARGIAKLGSKVVLIKGGHFPGREVIDTIFVGGKFIELKGPRVVSEPTHGTGCSFSAAITAELAKGASIEQAVCVAKGFIARAIEGRLEVGKGLKPVNPLAALLLDAEKGRAVEEVWAAAQLLVSEPAFVELLPEVGSNIARALPNARSPSEVVGLSGRIVRVGERASLMGFPTLGGSEHVANLVLTAMRHDPKIRAGLNLRFSNEIVGSCRKLGFCVGQFDRRLEPKGVKTMVWGVEQAIKKAGRVPDVIFDRGAVGKEPMVRLLGRSAIELAERALRIAKILGKA